MFLITSTSNGIVVDGGLGVAVGSAVGLATGRAVAVGSGIAIGGTDTVGGGGAGLSDEQAASPTETSRTIAHTNFVLINFLNFNAISPVRLVVVCKIDVI